MTLARTLLALAAVPVAVALGGCSSMRSWAPGFIQPYRPDVQQGNVVTQEMVDQLRDSMTRDQVRFLLGTPLLTSIFHQERWDYVYYLQRGNSDERQLRKLTVWFKDNRLERVQADPMPSEKMADNLILGRNPKDAPKAPPKEAPATVNLPAK